MKKVDINFKGTSDGIRIQLCINDTIAGTIQLQGKQTFEFLDYVHNCYKEFLKNRAEEAATNSY